MDFVTSIPGAKYISSSGSNGFVSIEERMSPIGLSETWRMGSMQRNYAYDHMGRLKVCTLSILGNVGNISEYL